MSVKMTCIPFARDDVAYNTFSPGIWISCSLFKAYLKGSVPLYTSVPSSPKMKPTTITTVVKATLLKLRKTARMERSNSRHEWTPPIQASDEPFADNVKALTEIRSVLGAGRVSRLPRLDQLSFQRMNHPRWNYAVPVALLIGHYHPPDDTSSHTGKPVYAFVDGPPCADPFVHIEFVGGEESLGIVFNRELGSFALRERRHTERNWEMFTCFVRLEPCFASTMTAEEFRVKLRYCFLLGWENKIPDLAEEVIPAGSEFDSDLADMCRGIDEAEVTSLQDLSMSEENIEARRKWSDVLSRSILGRLASIHQTEDTLENQQDLLKDVIPIYGTQGRIYRELVDDIERLENIIKTERARVRREIEDKKKVYQQISMATRN